MLVSKNLQLQRQVALLEQQCARGQLECMATSLDLEEFWSEHAGPLLDQSGPEDYEDILSALTGVAERLMAVHRST